LEEGATIASLNRSITFRRACCRWRCGGWSGVWKNDLDRADDRARLIPRWKASVIARSSIFNPDIGRFDAVADRTTKLKAKLG
jgi:hypothetical protein